MPSPKDANDGNHHLIHLSRPASSVFWFLWHSLAIVALVVIPNHLRFGAIWTSEAGTKTFFVGLIVTYCASTIVLTFYTPKGCAIRLIELASIFLSTFGSFFLFLLLSEATSYRFLLMVSLVVASAFTFLSLSLNTTLQKPALFIVTTFIALIPLKELVDRMRSSGVVVENKIIRTSFYNLTVRYYSNFLLQEVTGGAISKFGDRYLLAMGDGQLHILLWDQKTKKLESRKLSHRVPLNRDVFIRDTIQRKRVSAEFFRTGDILVQDFGDNFRLFASHHYWNSEKQCFTVRVSAIYGSYASFVTSEESHTWQTVYESDPCLTFKNKGDPFAGHAMGGKLVLLDTHTLLLTVGDHEFDGVESAEILSQDATASYGKIVLVNLNTHEASIYSIGHRNPQGLDVDPSGNIWLTEHGPKGGDELNLILKGANYGWPLVTYGTNYTQPIWPLNTKQGRHEGFELPIYAWVPSIGISAVVSVQGGLFKVWKDDLLVASLANKAIWRVRVEKGRTIFAERIHIGERIRDIIEDTDGRLILWTEQLRTPPTQTAIVVVELAAEDNDQALTGLSSAERGELLFIRCSGCHKLENGHAHGIGPDLQGIFQGPIAAAKGYTYSEALKGFSGTWTEENLGAFLTNPQSFAPGTAMQFEGIPDPTERASLILYLKSRK